MIQLKITFLIVIIFPFFLCGQSASSDTFRLFFLGGQSNMEGHGLIEELPEYLLSEDHDIWIFHGNPVPDEDKTGGLGKWDILKPGNGAGFTSDGISNKLSAKFGPELSFAKKMKEFYPEDKIALIKYARGGSSLDSSAARHFGSWEIDYNNLNGINQFDHFLTTVRQALKSTDINGDGLDDVLIPKGIIWMQGESDSFDEQVASRYYDNLKRLMNLIRASLRIDDLPVVIGKISDSGQDNNGKTWKYGELVQYAQEKYVINDKNAAIVRSTKDYTYSDPWHYDSAGYIDLGVKFAEAVFELNRLHSRY